MSRIGKNPVTIPSGIEVLVNGKVIVFKKGSIQKELDTKGNIEVKVENGQIVFSAKSDDRQDRAYWGTYRALSANIIVGLTKGYQKQLEINGVGYKAIVKGNILELQLGFSHPINYEFPKGLQISVEKNIITIKGDDKQVVGQVAAEVRSFRPPEPYKGKGVKYVEEHIRRKAGKTAKK
ncbi:MAG: 50S ribosomal protein L6 [Sulfurospirillum sp.]|nr:50S ribosomal protein L6 [Sulfurospirillum sp.]MBL0702797.1 50S ribosomal protein L6 [Sulfurospirillum sp.]